MHCAFVFLFFILLYCFSQLRIIYKLVHNRQTDDDAANDGVHFSLPFFSHRNQDSFRLVNFHKKPIFHFTAVIIAIIVATVILLPLSTRSCHLGSSTFVYLHFSVVFSFCCLLLFVCFLLFASRFFVTFHQLKWSRPIKKKTEWHFAVALLFRLMRWESQRETKQIKEILTSFTFRRRHHRRTFVHAIFISDVVIAAHCISRSRFCMLIFFSFIFSTIPSLVDVGFYHYFSSSSFSLTHRLVCRLIASTSLVINQSIIQLMICALTNACVHMRENQLIKRRFVCTFTLKWLFFFSVFVVWIHRRLLRQTRTSNRCSIVYQFVIVLIHFFFFIFLALVRAEQNKAAEEKKQKVKICKLDNWEAKCRGETIKPLRVGIRCKRFSNDHDRKGRFQRCDQLMMSVYRESVSRFVCAQVIELAQSLVCLRSHLFAFWLADDGTPALDLCVRKTTTSKRKMHECNESKRVLTCIGQPVAARKRKTKGEERTEKNEKSLVFCVCRKRIFFLLLESTTQ